MNCGKSGRSKEALPLAEGVANCRRRILGARHRDYAMGLFNLAAQHQALREFDRAEALYLQALAIIKERLGERHPDTLLCMHNLGQLYHDRGDDDRAESLLGETLKKRKEVIGVDHDDYATTRDTLIGIMGQRIHDAKDRADFEAARQVQQRLVKLLIELFTIDDWRVADARLAAIDLERLTRLGKDDRDRLRKATESSRESDRLWNSGKFQDALKVGEGVAESRRRILGEHNPDYALSLRDLADRHQNLREFNRAETLYLQALAIFKERLGQGYHDRAARPDGIDGLAEEFGDLDSTETDFRTSGSSREKVGGGSALDYALTLTRLGYLYERMGDYARAVPADREALDVFRRLDGENHANYAATLNNLAMLYQDMGDYAQAEPLLRQACDLSRDSRFISPLMYAVNLNNLGSLYNYIGEYALAEPLHRECAEVRKAVLGEKHPDYAQSLDNLAFMYSQMEDDARAEPLFRKASEIYRAANGHDSPDYAINLQNLAWISLRRGDFAEADRLSQESLSIFKKAVGEKHEYYHAGLSLHSRVREAVGDAGEAEQIARQSLELRRRHLELTAAVQSERQQLVMAGDLRSALDRYLSLAIPLRLNGDQVYPYVLAWKGLVLARQRALREAKRIAHKNGDAEARRLGSALDEVSSKLARLALSTDDPAEAHAGRSEVQRLTLEMERLEGELAGRSASFRKFEELLKLKPDQIKQVLPGDATLVDLLVYSRFSPSHLTKGRMTSRQHIVAFVIRPGRPVEMVPLGPAEPIDRAVESWRAGYGRADDNDDPGAELRRLVWRRWEKQVAGARTVLISPDGSLARLPFPALPGGVPGKYLIEELSVAVVPVPLLLPELLGAAPPSEGKSEPPSLLLVGDVSYDTSPGKGSQGVSRMAARDGMLGTFSQLQGTREEIEALGTLFVKRYPGLHPDVLRGERATETLFRTEAPRHRWVHLATHGFFAPEQLHSALAPDRDAENTVRDIFGHQGVDGINPGLLSGIVLSGVNRRGGYGDDDGILTALEVAALDLGDLELGTLSACETGLGTMAGGEGLLGLQRAFQVAGARTVVASFWKVNDRATQAFMRRFYANLWRDKQPLGKLEALREAQLWMMREGDRLPSEGRQSSPAPPSSPPTPTRDLEPLPEPVTREGGPRQPYFWAAFMLSGDWR